MSHCRTKLSENRGWLGASHWLDILRIPPNCSFVLAEMITFKITFLSLQVYFTCVTVPAICSCWIVILSYDKDCMLSLDRLFFCNKNWLDMGWLLLSHTAWKSQPV